jgi:hypothetical protein
MAFVNHPVEEPEKSLKDYASPWCEDIKIQESDLKLEATKYEIKPKIIEMVAATRLKGWLWRTHIGTCWRCILVHLACSLHFGLDLIMELTRH